MRNLILIAGAATMLAVGAPAIAKPGHGNGNKSHATVGHGKAGHGIVVSDRYGRLYALNARGACPPGLAKRNNGCQPPGQAKKQYNVGQRYNRNFGNVWAYNDIPEYLRNQYALDNDDRYYYTNGYLYQVDPRTMLVQQVISALLR